MEKETPSEAPPPYYDPRYPPTGGKAPTSGTAPPPEGTYPPPGASHPAPAGAYSPPMAQGPPTPTHAGGHGPPAGNYPPPQGMGQPAGNYPQPQGMYAPPPAGSYGQHPGTAPAGQPHQVVVVQQPAMVQTTVVRQNFGPSPASTVCPYCQAQIVTRTTYTPGVLAWVMCLVLFFVFWPICWLPFVIDSCQDTNHSCPNCGRVIAST